MAGSGLKVGHGNGSHMVDHTNEMIEVMEAVEFGIS